MQSFSRTPKSSLQSASQDRETLSTNGAAPQDAREEAERNDLLRSLPPEDYARIHPHLKRVHLNVRDVLAEPGEVFRYVYFIESGVASIVNHVSGGTVEVGTVGNEGIAGLSVFLDGGADASRTIIQVQGEAKRIPAEVFTQIADESPALRRILHRYTQAFITQVAQTAACNRNHKLEERCARWLLMTHDRVDGSDTFALTHQFLAYMLGVRRSGVTIAAGTLQKAGLIRYTRGQITITDRKGLEEASCECYAVVREHFDRLLS
jgi:CRP-like cAMP-binding protein